MRAPSIAESACDPLGCMLLSSGYDALRATQGASPWRRTTASCRSASGRPPVRGAQHGPVSVMTQDHMQDPHESEHTSPLIIIRWPGTSLPQALCLSVHTWHGEDFLLGGKAGLELTLMRSSCVMTRALSSPKPFLVSSSRLDVPTKKLVSSWNPKSGRTKQREAYAVPVRI